MGIFILYVGRYCLLAAAFVCPYAYTGYVLRVILEKCIYPGMVRP